MADVTMLLNRIHQGDAKATDELLPLVYEELRKLAADKLRREKPGQTIQATVLVHEAWLRISGKEPEQGAHDQREVAVDVDPVDEREDPVAVEDALLDVAGNAREQLSIADDRYILMGGAPQAGYRDYEDLFAARSAEPGIAAAPADPWCLMYTSGTTGNPKGAIRGHGGMSMLALMTSVEFSLTRRDHALLVMPMCHANSLNFFTSFLHAGAAITIFSRASFDPERCLRSLGEATFSSMVPTHYSMMQDIPGARRGDVTSVEKLLVSSATAFAETKQAIDAADRCAEQSRRRSRDPDSGGLGALGERPGLRRAAVRGAQHTLSAQR